MNSIKVRLSELHKEPVYKIISCENEITKINDMYSTLKTDIKEIIKTYSEELFLEYYPTDKLAVKIVSIKLDQNNPISRPTILFTDDKLPVKVIKQINTKVVEYQNVFDDLWHNLLIKNEIFKYF